MLHECVEFIFDYYTVTGLQKNKESWARNQNRCYRCILNRSTRIWRLKCSITTEFLWNVTPLVHKKYIDKAVKRCMPHNSPVKNYKKPCCDERIFPYTIYKSFFIFFFFEIVKCGQVSVFEIFFFFRNQKWWNNIISQSFGNTFGKTP